MSRNLLRKTSHDKLIMSNFIFDLLPFKRGCYLSITLSLLLPKVEYTRFDWEHFLLVHNQLYMKGLSQSDKVLL